MRSALSDSASLKDLKDGICASSEDPDAAEGAILGSSVIDAACVVLHADSDDRGNASRVADALQPSDDSQPQLDQGENPSSATAVDAVRSESSESIATATA